MIYQDSQKKSQQVEEAVLRVGEEGIYVRGAANYASA